MAATKKGTHVKGQDLVPSTDQFAAGAVKEYLFWVGVVPDCPRESIDLAGVNFPKVNEELVSDPLRTGMKQRIPVIGAIVRLTEAKFHKMRERLPRTVIRFIDGKGSREEPGTGKNMGDNHEQPRKGHVITIPTKEEIKQREKSGKPTRAYVAQSGDVPAARLMFAVMCEDQVKGERGRAYPPSLEETGLRWPDAFKTKKTAELLS